MSEPIPYVPPKKIFFLYPIGIVYDLLKDLIKHGYESYVIKDHNQMMKLLDKYPDCILYINIFEKMNEEEWENYIKIIQDDPKYAAVQLGICVYKTGGDEELQQKYLIEYMLTGGYINLHVSYKRSLETIFKILKACEARGRRKYIRVAPFVGDENTFAQITKNGKQIKGRIVDLSIYCMTVEFGKGFFVKNEMIRNMMVKLRGIITTADVLVKGFLEGNEGVYLMIFVFKNDEKKEKVYDYIYERLQTEVQNVED